MSRTIYRIYTDTTGTMTEQEIKMMAHNAVERVSKVLGDVSTAEIMGKDRHFKVATARQLVFWYLFNVCKMTWTEIGRAMGKHHATALYGERQISIMLSRNRTKEDKRIYNAAEALREQDTRAVEINN